MNSFFRLFLLHLIIYLSCLEREVNIPQKFLLRMRVRSRVFFFRPPQLHSQFVTTYFYSHFALCKNNLNGCVLFNCAAREKCNHIYKKKTEREQKKIQSLYKKVHCLPNRQANTPPTFVRRPFMVMKQNWFRIEWSEKKTHQFRKNRFMSWRIQMNVCSEIKTHWQFSSRWVFFFFVVLL